MAPNINKTKVENKTNKTNKTKTYNRYGVQLGAKVPLWGGFTGDGKFTLRLWSARSKFTKDEWAQQLPQLRKAAENK